MKEKLLPGGRVLCNKNLECVPLTWGLAGRWRQEVRRKKQIIRSERSQESSTGGLRNGRKIGKVVICSS